MSKRDREDAEQKGVLKDAEQKDARTYAFFTFYTPGSYGYDELVAKHQQAGCYVKWSPHSDWTKKPWANLKEGEWMSSGKDELVFRVPMTTDLAKQQVKPLPKAAKTDDDDDEESWETRQARNYLRYA